MTVPADSPGGSAAPPEAAEPGPVPGRTCGTCTMCCKVIAVTELAKPAGTWCPHCVRNRGCGIYESRPVSCRRFYCLWMLAQGLGPEWKPERAKFALARSEGGRRLTALVDPGYPSAWQRPPYYQTLKQWAAEGARRLPDIEIVTVMIGARCIVVLPDRDEDLGVLAADDTLKIDLLTSGTRQKIEVRKVKRQTPADAASATPAADR